MTPKTNRPKPSSSAPATSAQAAAPRPVGRPNTYDPAFGEQMLAFCREGYSITAFAGEIGVSRRTITEWAAANPEFSLALHASKAASARWWEEKGRRVGETGGGPGTATMIVFQLRNVAQDDFIDRQHLEHSGPDGSPLSSAPVTIQITPIPSGMFFDANGNLVKDEEA